MKFTLTEEQLKHKEGINWLLSGPRGYGKTTLLAVCIIEHAMKNAGCRIDFHEPLGRHPKGEQYLTQQIKAILNTDKEFAKQFVIGQGWIKYR